MRSVPEWIADHDDQAVPPRVRVRVFDAYGGRCYLSGVKIQPGDKWELEHVKALCLGGEHRESNLAPALVGAHKGKTARDRRAKAKNDRVRKKHLGVHKRKHLIPGSKGSGWRKPINGPAYRVSETESV